MACGRGSGCPAISLLAESDSKPTRRSSILSRPDIPAIYDGHQMGTGRIRSDARPRLVRRGGPVGLVDPRRARVARPVRAGRTACRLPSTRCHRAQPRQPNADGYPMRCHANKGIHGDGLPQYPSPPHDHNAPSRSRVGACHPVPSGGDAGALGSQRAAPQDPTITLSTHPYSEWRVSPSGRPQGTRDRTNA